MRILLLALIGGLSIVPGASAQQASDLVIFAQERPPSSERFRITVGALVGPSGYLTVETAPDSPPPPSESQVQPSELTHYAELAGVSNEEAAKRLREQEAFRPTLERILAQVRRNERGNFTEVELVHRPDWVYLIYFKREPEKTLAKYTRSPRVQARSSRYTRDELEELAQPWIDRFNTERLITGYGMNARRGTADIDLLIGEGEFEEIAKRNGWGAVPDFLRLRFATPPVGPAIDPQIANGLRIFPQRDRALGIIHMAAYHGRIVLRDGCFFVEDGMPSTGRSLAYFPREVGLYVDPQGYLALRTRTEEPRHVGRIGERFTWAGPIGISEDAPMVAELRQRCGDAPLIQLSVPDSESIMHARYPHLRGATPPPPPPASPERNPI